MAKNGRHGDDTELKTNDDIEVINVEDGSVQVVSALGPGFINKLVPSTAGAAVPKGMY